MLPESQFPVTGGIMQTEEIVPRAQSTGLDATASDPGSLFQPQQSPIRFAQPIQYPIPSFVGMAVKQEPQEDDEQGRQQPNSLGPQTEIEDAQSISDGNHKRATDPAAAVVAAEYSGQSPQTPQQNGCKKPASRGRRKSRWKLKFHHQALPPEYLDHYEAALAQEAALNTSAAPAPIESRVASPVPTMPIPGFGPAATNPMTDVQSWLQRLAAMQSEIYANPLQAGSPCGQTTAARRSVITSTQSQPVFGHRHHPHHRPPQSSSAHRSVAAQAQPSPRPPMKYSDLPYMGEITLDNSKPRRGRKPKKADICHLIYKNYGTILPGTPGLEDKSRLPQPTTPRDKLDSMAKETGQLPTPYQRTDIQNRISSLLEKRLTQERRALEISVHQEQEEPLNLCIRDLNLLKIRLGEKQTGSAYGSCYSKSEGSSDAEDVPEYPPARGQPVDCNGEVNGTEQPSGESDARTHVGQMHAELNGHADLANNNDPSGKQNPGLLYWPNAGVFIHPVALQSQFLYYQKLAQEKALEPPAKEQRIVPKSIYSMLESPKTPVSPVEATTQPQEAVPTPSPPRPKRNSTSQAPTTATPQSSTQPTKRKRSAIFIPPMPTENNNNPATEVSICKFKFTGGAKPSLQEKKSLSVDSGGNFRYYSGTGDKSMRGYEFFPREALQQPASGNQSSASAAGAFLSAAGERLPGLQPTSCPGRVVGHQDEAGRSRKRKTRKSMQREKLEQTFKEKGFLIQTQQLESAEGATYCKFRQLRKFTRYLFRSWKDYLPGNVRELNDSGEPIPAASPVALKELEHQPDAAGEATRLLSPVSPASLLELQHPRAIAMESSPPAAGLSLN